MGLDDGGSPIDKAGTVGSIADILRSRAAEHPEATAYRYIEGEAPASSISYGELLRRSAALAAVLRALAPAGARVLLLLHPGLDYVVGLYACFLGQLVAVPAYPPRPRRGSSALRLICEDCAPAAILVGEKTDLDALALADIPSAIPVVTAPSQASGVEWTGPFPERADLALLQYTSGSTGRPKGVMVSHGNLLDNLGRQQALYRVDSRSRAAIWLPPYHDMGLGSGILQPLFSDSTVTLLSPMHTMQRPMRWLRAIHETRATVSGGPPFAFAACVAAVSNDDLQYLDLSSWTCAFVGAEPVTVDVLDAFAEKFAPCGFRRTAFQPSYGLAEATLLVCGAPSGLGHAAHPAGAGRGAARVSCGRPVADHTVLIVQPSDRHVSPDGRSGEIWIRGPSVAAGYWNDPERTEATFGAYLADGRGPFLRTGDLGVIQGGELCVLGRSKDVVILAGRKLHSEDIEASVRRAGILGLDGAALAAFGAEVAGQERLVLAVEVRRRPDDDDATAALSAAISRAVAQEHDASVFAVTFVGPGGLPKTSSGKIQRHLCRDDYLRLHDAPVAAPT